MASQGSLTAILSCFGLMADIYDFHIVNLVRPVLEEEFGPIAPSQNAMLTGAALFGSVIGMIGFGAAADVLGRRCLFISTAILVGVASLGCMCAGPFMGLGMYEVLAIWRFVLGLGIGGEYPLAAASIVENNDSATSATGLAVAFSGMALGQLLAPGLVMLLAGPLDVDHSKLWRFGFGFGAVLALVVALLRYVALRETKGWTDSQQEISRSSNDSRVQLSPQAPPAGRVFRDKAAALMAMKWSLISTVGGWFIYDVVTYGTGLYSTTIFPAPAGIGSAKVVLYINLLSLPGYAGAIYFASFCRQKHMQLAGLVGMSLCFMLMAVFHRREYREGIGYMSVFAVQRSIDAMGPGIATFAIPGQIYPTRIRATAHGISAAAGKLGGVVGTVIFPMLWESAGLQAAMAFMAFTSAIAAFWTQLFTPLYDSSALGEIEALDSTMGVVQQAAMAEAILFGSIKAESTSLMPDKKNPGKSDYGMRSEINAARAPGL